MTQITVGSLFSGIGGLELGLERAGMRTVWQVEKDDYCRLVLAKHWPDVERFEDVKDVGAHNLKPVDLICGGFPCQDISYAKQDAQGISGGRSGLWTEYARILRDLRPRYVVVENVPALLGRGLGVVLGDLARLGYDAEWSVLPACAFGAPHPRERVFVCAYPDGIGLARRANQGGGREGGTRAAQQLPRLLPTNPWTQVPEPRIERVAHGLPNRVERTTAVGNAVSPPVAEYIGRLIVEADRQSQAVA